jgi:hypothetical protein
MGTSGSGVGLAAVAIAALLAMTAAPLRAQSADAAIQMGDSDVAGTVTGPNGPVAGVWVIAETAELGDFVYLPDQDGVLPGVPAQDRDGNPHDFSGSALLAAAPHLDLTRQGQFDAILGTAHLGILNSPVSRQAALKFLASLRINRDDLGHGDDD